MFYRADCFSVFNGLFFMALKSTVFKAVVQIADMDRSHYADYSLTLARHPSETDERMMIRLFAFALFAGPDLAFANGLCVDEEPDVWQKDLTGRIVHWIQVGQPEEKWLRKACGRADAVDIFAYGRAASLWWRGIEEKLSRLDNLNVWQISAEESTALGLLAMRAMRLQFTIQDGSVWVSDGEKIVQIEPTLLQGKVVGM